MVFIAKDIHLCVYVCKFISLGFKWFLINSGFIIIFQSVQNNPPKCAKQTCGSSTQPKIILLEKFNWKRGFLHKISRHKQFFLYGDLAPLVLLIKTRKIREKLQSQFFLNKVFLIFYTNPFYTSAIYRFYLSLYLV